MSTDFFTYLVDCEYLIDLNFEFLSDHYGYSHEPVKDILAILVKIDSCNNIFTFKTGEIYLTIPIDSITFAKPAK